MVGLFGANGRELAEPDFYSISIELFIVCDIGEIAQHENLTEQRASMLFVGVTNLFLVPVFHFLTAWPVRAKRL